MKIVRFVKKVFIIRLTILSNLTNTIPLSAALLNAIHWMQFHWVVFQWIINHVKQDHKTGNVNSNNPIFYPFSVRTSTCSGNCNNINDPYTRICVPDIEKI